ncbi:MAG: hypothetical protein N0E59_00830 [Candidatus Thiodiazotropha taylori]|nr:hypothetical protein [Candidatus Thiodiazotropha taylori]MCG8109286.1 hypothetical protein [Candidatus Thiodiazotropha taylori]MCW4281624.1 hypothetical protein [Candidatus Thiodiazotropha taylori]MCW4303583.1 hypothetical protein [Candidatus Thiodiazotropha taylori]
MGQDEQTRLMVKTTHRKKELFKWACEVLHINEESFLDSCLKQAVLNSLHVIREHGADESRIISADDAETMLNEVWGKRFGQTTYAAGLFD